MRHKVLGLAALLQVFAHGAFAGCEVPHTVPAGYVGIHLNYAGASIRWPGQADTPLPQNAKTVRLWDSYGATWLDLEPRKGEWDFRYLDHYVLKAKARGMDIILTLGMTPKWASSAPAQEALHGAGSAAPPANFDDWENYVKVVAQRYRGQIKYYEIWNEPAFNDIEAAVSTSNRAGFFSGSAADMVALSTRAARAIRAADADARIISPAMAGHYQGLKRLERFLALGGGGSFDILGFHYYQTDTWLPERLPALIQRVQDLATRYGFQGPLWNTEIGLVIESPGKTVAALEPNSQGVLGRVFGADEAAGVMARYLILGAACGVQRSYWLAWDNGSMGLSYVAADKLRKLNSAGVAFENLAKWLAGSTVGPCTQSGSVWSCVMKSPLLGAGRWTWDPSQSDQGTGPGTNSFGRVTNLDGSVIAAGTFIVRARPVFVSD